MEKHLFKEKLKVQYRFDPTLSGLAKMWNLKRNKFYVKLREYGIIDDENQPMPEYEKFFEPYRNENTRWAGKPGHYVSAEGQKLIIKTLKEEDFEQITILKPVRKINQPTSNQKFKVFEPASYSIFYELNE